MPNLNRVMLMGNLTRDPELKYTPNNNTVCKIGLACNHTWKDNDGQKQVETTFIDCEAWGRTAEVINEYLRKGRPIFIEGRLKLDQWQDKDGNNRSKIKVVVESFEFIDARGGGDDQGPSQRSSPPPPSAAAAPASAPAPPPHEPVGEDDIPF